MEIGSVKDCEEVLWTLSVSAGQLFDLRLPPGSICTLAEATILCETSEVSFIPFCPLFLLLLPPFLYFLFKEASSYAPNSSLFSMSTNIILFLALKSLSVSELVFEFKFSLMFCPS